MGTGAEVLVWIAVVVAGIAVFLFLIRPSCSSCCAAVCAASARLSRPPWQ